MKKIIAMAQGGTNRGWRSKLKNLIDALAAAGMATEDTSVSVPLVVSSRDFSGGAPSADFLL
jgi:hypothetical protein